MPDDLTQQLLDLKRQIEVDREKKARLEGKLASLMERLEKEFECGSVQEAEAKLETLNVEIKELEAVVRGKIDGIRHEYTAKT